MPIAPRLDRVCRDGRVGPDPSTVGAFVLPKGLRALQLMLRTARSVPKGGELLDHLGVLGSTGLTAYFVCTSPP